MAHPPRRSLRLPRHPLARALGIALALLALTRGAAAQERIHRTYSVADGLVQSEVRCLFEDRDGYLWIGTGSGVSRFDGATFTNFQEPDGPPAGQVNSIAQAADGALLFGTDLGLGIYAGGRWSVPPLAGGLTPGMVRAIVPAGDGGLLAVGWRGGVMARRPDGSFATLPLPGAPEPLRGTSLLAGRDGTLWLGTSDQGLWAFRGGRRTGHWAAGLDIASLAEGPDGVVYAGSEKGVAVYRAGRLAPLPGWPVRSVRKVAFGSDGTLYAGTTAAGLFFGRPDRPPERIDRAQGLPHDQVNDLRETRGGTVYVGTERGLSPLDRGRLTAWLPRHGLPDSTVWGFAEEPGAGGGQRLLMATENGLATLEDGQLSPWRLALPERTVRSLWRSPSGLLYVGTRSGGVAIVERGRVVRTLGTADGLPNLFVIAIAEGPDCTVYFGTSKGLSIWRDGRITHLGSGDGIPPVNALAPSPDGALYLGTVEGLMRWDGRTLRTWTERDGLAARVVFSVTVGPDGAVYAGTVRGLSILRDGRCVQYTNLSPGDYRFEVQAAAGAGDGWSGAAHLPFTILTPLWRRWWSLLLATLLAGGTVALLLSARVRQLLAIERLRTALAADLHDHIGAGLTEISILSEIAARRAGGSPAGQDGPRAAPELGKMAEIARHLVDRMDDIVWLVNPRRDSLHELFLRLKDSYADLFAGSGILFKTTDLRLFEGIHLPMSYRENLYLIFKEALNNSLRHSGCREITLDVAVAGRRLEVRLADDGRGFDPAAPGSGDGLANLRLRAERIGGRLTVASAPGAGTEVRFSGPRP